MDGLWGPSGTAGTDTSVSLGFEDSFSPQESSEVENIAQSPSQGVYLVVLLCVMVESANCCGGGG